MKRYGVLVCSVFVALAVGCGGGAAPVQTSGTITFEGKPVTDANVLFTPKGTGVVANGKTDAQGKFKLTTRKPGDGAIPGDYVVSVTPDTPPPAEDDYSAPAPPLFAVEFTSAAGSKLKATVKAGSGNDFPLSLE